MTLAQLRYTIAIAKAGSMNEAAKSLYISQPSLSTAIRELEAETGVEIFRRTNRGIAVTPAGEEFLGYARQVVEQYELMEAKYISKEQSRKKFSVSMQHYTFAVNAFVELVKQFGMDCGPRIAGGVDEIGAFLGHGAGIEPAKRIVMDATDEGRRQPGAEGGAPRQHGADHRRERHRQGDAGAADPCRIRPTEGTLHCGEPRGGAA